MRFCGAANPEHLDITCIIDLDDEPIHDEHAGGGQLWPNPDYVNPRPDTLPLGDLRAISTRTSRRRPRERLSDPAAPGTQLRRDPHDTEVKAAWVALAESGNWRRVVLDHIALCEEVGSTDDRTEVVFRKGAPSVTARRYELEKGGWIVDSTRRRPTRSGVGAIVWVLTDRGREEWTGWDRDTLPAEWKDTGWPAGYGTPGPA